MLGARHMRLSDAPPMQSAAGVHGQTREEIRPKLDLEGVRRLYLGFPIWSYAPAPPIWQLLEPFDLDGIEIVPFFTFLHGVKETEVERLAERLRQSGARVLPHVAIRVPASMSMAHLERRAHESLLARPDLWRSEPEPEVQCHPDPAAQAHTLCKVPAGRVWVGDDGSQASPAGYVHPKRLTVAAFEIDRTEVTIAQYAGCERASQCPIVERFDPCDKLVADGDDKPMPCVSLAGARAYCRWVGMRLPHEAEWMRAARGESAAAYPWGSSDPGADRAARGNFGEKPETGMEGYSLVEPGRAWVADGAPRLSKGCAFPAGNSPFGVCDLAGNIGEWVEPAGASTPVFKGGTWMDADLWSFRVASRAWMSLDREVSSVGYYLTGFRCARTAAP
jgi:formylglycine-generating enzyme required for sulfatase activity